MPARGVNSWACLKSTTSARATKWQTGLNPVVKWAMAQKSCMIRQPWSPDCWCSTDHPMTDSQTIRQRTHRKTTATHENHRRKHKTPPQRKKRAVRSSGCSQGRSGTRRWRYSRVGPPRLAPCSKLRRAAEGGSGGDDGPPNSKAGGVRGGEPFERHPAGAVRLPTRTPVRLMARGTSEGSGVG